MSFNFFSLHSLNFFLTPPFPIPSLHFLNLLPFYPSKFLFSPLSFYFQTILPRPFSRLFFSFFIYLSSSTQTSREQMQQIESTCLYHVIAALKKNQPLTREVLKYLKVFVVIALLLLLFLLLLFLFLLLLYCCFSCHCFSLLLSLFYLH